MERRRFTREFKLEAVRLIRDRGVSYAQASEDLKVHPIGREPRDADRRRITCTGINLGSTRFQQGLGKSSAEASIRARDQLFLSRDVHHCSLYSLALSPGQNISC